MSGILAQVNIEPRGDGSTCTNTWNDPTPQVIGGLQEIMFRAALSVKNGSWVREALSGNKVQPVPIEMHQDVRALSSVSQPVFHMDRGCLAAGAVVMIGCVIIVASTFYGWWKVGRTVSMSPVEIAKAFNAPVLQSRGLGSDLDGMLPVVGYRRVRYGEVRYRDGEMLYPEDPGERDASGIQSRLELTHLHWASTPRNGAQYV